MPSLAHAKLLGYAAGVGIRTDYVRQALRATNENIYSLERIINSALPDACRYVESFEDYVGEPMPAHVYEACTTEIAWWRALGESLQDYHASDPNEHDEVTYAKNVRRFLSIQHDLLQLTEEALTSCLVEHYRAALSDLRAQARKVAL